MPAKTKKWKMPEWMEPYRDHIINTGGNSVEDMMNGNADPIVNLPLSTLQACVKSQVHMLTRLREYSLLRSDTPGILFIRLGVALQSLQDQGFQLRPGTKREVRELTYKFRTWLDEHPTSKGEGA